MTPETQPHWDADWRGRVTDEESLVRFVDAVGCCAINALERYPQFPSVAVAMARPDALWHAWWWKDDLHIAKRLYYTRLFGGRPGFISLAWLPAFIAANGAAADELFLLGQVPAEVQRLYAVIDAHGPIAIRALKKLLGPDERKAANAGLWELERRFLITKTALTGRERGTYGYVWDLLERWLPDAFPAADRLRRPAARTQIAEHLATLGVPVDDRLRTRVLRWGEER
jgi:hypothetical protein